MKTLRRILYGLALGLCWLSVTDGEASAMSEAPKAVFEFFASSLLGEIGTLNLWNKVALFVVPFVGLLALWPESRAWIYALCGNYEAAAEIYEKKMRRGRVTPSAYLRLASLYLLQGRNDARALLAYRIVREINVAMRAHSHIPEVVEFELVA